jgi:predicted PurR-regulated permease PerM
MIKQVVVIGTAVMTTLLALVVLWQFRIVVVYVLISLALAATVRPFIKNLTRRKLVMRLALILFYMAILGGFGFLVFHIVRFAVGDIQQVAQTLSVQGDWVLPPWLEGSPFQYALVARLPTPDKLFEAITGERGQLVLPAVLGFTEGFGGIASGMLLVLILSIYWSINQVHFERLWLSLLPAEQRKQARNVWRTIELDLGVYIRSKLVSSLLAALLLGLGYWLLGSRYPVLMALTGALVWLIPVVGAPLAMILPLLMGLLTSVQLSLFTILYTFVVLIALQVWVEPRLFKRKWDNHILTLVMVLVMADAFGLIGILAAPPLSAVCQILWHLLVSSRLNAGAAVQVSDLKERQARLWTVIKEMGEPPPPLVLSSMERLANLLEKAEPILPVVLPPEPSEPVSEGGPPVSTKS